MRHVVAVVALLLPTLASAGPITLSTSDGKSIKATEYGSGAKGVVLVHDDQASAKDWTTFATKLSTAGFHVVALDLRGHGANGGPAAEADYPLMAHDVSAAAGWLATKGGAPEVMVVGAGLGGSIALNAAVTTPAIAGVAMLTPSLGAKGVKVSAAITQLGARPLLLVVDDTDALAGKAATLLAAKATGPKEVQTYPGGGVGVAMLNAVPDLEPLIVGWLNGSWKGPAEAGNSASLNAGAVEEVTTTGTKFGEKPK